MLTTAGFNRRMRKTARPVVWKAHGSQSPRAHPIPELSRLGSSEVRNRTWMKKILISEDAFGDLNEGFLFYKAQDFGLGDYFNFGEQGQKFLTGFDAIERMRFKNLSRIFD